MAQLQWRAVQASSAQAAALAQAEAERRQEAWPVKYGYWCRQKFFLGFRGLGLANPNPHPFF
jgi:hypothetical protein